MPREASKKREREYKELKREFKKEHRYRGREEEVAARIVNKQRARFGETKSAKRKDRQGKSPDRDLPIKNYEHKTIAQVERALRSLSPGEVKQVERHEKKHKNRKSLLEILRDRSRGGGTSSRSRSGAGKSPRTAKQVKAKSSRSAAPRSSSRPAKSRTKSSSSKAGKRSQTGRRNAASESEGKVTTDHDEIRRWVEERGGHPATVRSTIGDGHEPGILRIDFPGYSGEQSLEEISWDEVFEKFEQENLAFLHQDETADGEKSRFNKLIAR